MFITVQAHEYDSHRHLLAQMFRLRKRVFLDELGWSVTAHGDQERDAYDDLEPVYLLWCSDDRQTLYASMRLMPTTGPTLLYDVFRSTFPAAAELSAPCIWEGTRCCVDVEALAHDHPEIEPGRAFGMLCLATAECALAHGIHSVISNYEPQMRRVYMRAGLMIDELGRADTFGRRPVCCGVFTINREIVLRSRAKLGLTQPLYEVFARSNRQSRRKAA